MIVINQVWMFSPTTMRCFHINGAFFDIKETKHGLEFITAFRSRFKFNKSSRASNSFWVSHGLKEKVTQAYMNYNAEKELLS